MKALGVYVAASWGIIQVIDVLTQNVGLPSWAFSYALILLGIGFPIVGVTAFLNGMRLGRPADWGEYEGSISPNGRWMAYTSDEAEREEVFVRGFPEPLGQVQVSSDGAYDPVWSPDGRALYFRAHDGTLNRADVDPDGARFSVSAVTSLFDWPYASAGGQSIGYGMHPDGTRFVAKPNLVRGDFGEVHVVVNWFEELRARAGEARR